LAGRNSLITSSPKNRMKFLMLIYSDSALIDAMPAGQFDRTMSECIAHADDLRGEGRLLDTQMLQDARTAKSIRIREGRRSITDGPFTETKELLAGFNLIEADSMEDALRIAQEFPWAATGCIEVREVRDVAAVRRDGWFGAGSGS
jgi:hypothetical protein